MNLQRRHARALLVLDGPALGRSLPADVLRHCVQLSPRLDILLINPPRETTSLLAVLLLRLEHSGIDYRIASAHGEIGEEILSYLSRHRGISALALIDFAPLSAETLELIELKGPQLISLATA